MNLLLFLPFPKSSFDFNCELSYFNSGFDLSHMIILSINRFLYGSQIYLLFFVNYLLFVQLISNGEPTFLPLFCPSKHYELYPELLRHFNVKALIIRWQPALIIWSHLSWLRSVVALDVGGLSKRGSSFTPLWQF